MSKTFTDQERRRLLCQLAGVSTELTEHAFMSDGDIADFFFQPVTPRFNYSYRELMALDVVTMAALMSSYDRPEWQCSEQIPDSWFCQPVPSLYRPARPALRLVVGSGYFVSVWTIGEGEIPQEFIRVLQHNKLQYAIRNINMEEAQNDQT